MEVEYTKNTSYDAFTFNSDTTKILLQILFSVIIFLIVFGLLGYAYSYLTGNQVQLPGLQKITS